MRILAIILGCFFLFACASEEKYDDMLSSWHGESAAKLIAKWGEPAEKISSEDGNVHYIYKSIQKVHRAPEITPSYITVSGSGSDARVIATPASTVPGDTYTLECTTWFVVNPLGNIIGARSVGNDCTADDQQIKEFGYQKA